jgi:hypothetical protein
MAQFVENLEATVLGDLSTAPTEAEAGAASEGADPSEASATERSSDGVRVVDAPEVAPVDLLGTAGTPIMKRLLPALGIVIALVAFRYLWKRRQGGEA